MAPKKSKGIKMDINIFLNDKTLGTWADEMESMPTAPSGDPSASGGLGGSHLRNNQEYGARGGADRGGYGDRGDYGDRPPRAEVPLPTVAPFTAFLGNLSWDASESDIQGYFPDLTTTSVRLVSGPDGKPKGFGYIEFLTLADLVSALAQNGAEIAGRSIRISVAEAKGREGRADEDMTWERSGPLPPLAGRTGGSSSFGGGGNGYDRPREGGFGSSGGAGGFGGEGDGPRAGFGSKFVPSVDSPGRNNGFEQRSSSGGGYERAAGPSYEERGERSGFGSKFVPSQAPSTGGSSSYERNNDRRGSAPPEEERSWTRSGPLPPLARVGRPAGSSFGDSPSADAASSPSYQPQQRRKLELSARSAPSPSSSSTTTPSPQPDADADSIAPEAVAKLSPFGAAKPVDTVERQTTPSSSTSAAASTPASTVTPLPKKRSTPSPFGTAKPIDLSAKEQEVADKIDRMREQDVLKAKDLAALKEEAKKAEKEREPVWGRAASSPATTEEGGAQAKKEYRKASYDAAAPKNTSRKSSTTTTAPTSSPTAAASAVDAAPATKKAPTVVTKPSLRKEGFSYSSMANTPAPAVVAAEKKAEVPTALLTKLEETTI